VRAGGRGRHAAAALRRAAPAAAAVTLADAPVLGASALLAVLGVVLLGLADRVRAAVDERMAEIEPARSPRVRVRVVTDRRTP
jgi:CHASE2 domain-containing sensor protein